MKKYFYSILILVFAWAYIYSFSEANAKKTSEPMSTAAPTSFYDLCIPSLNGADRLCMKDFKGKYVLCVNVASECGYTPQYAELQKLADTYKDKLVVVGFPCNQFLGQEPGTATEIQQFCTKNYGITFPLTEKIEVKGNGKHLVYQWLTEKALNGQMDVKIGWNFNKILVDPNGNWLKHFSSNVKPMSEEIISLLK